MRARERVFVPDIPPHVAEVIRSLPPEIMSRGKGAIRAICIDPGVGERLQRELTGLWKYRVRRYRIVCLVDRSGKTLRPFAVGRFSMVLPNPQRADARR